MAQLGSAPRLGRGGRTFKSCHPDHLEKRTQYRFSFFINILCGFMKIQKIMQKNRTLKDIRRVKSYPSKSSNSFMDKKQGAEFPTIVISGTEMQQYAKVIKEKINNWKRIFGDF